MSEMAKSSQKFFEVETCWKVLKGPKLSSEALINSPKFFEVEKYSKFRDPENYLKIN